LGDSFSKKWQILSAISIGTIMVPINASIVNVSLPTIATYFVASITSVEWVLTAYLITLLGMVLFFGRFGDSIGHERLYLMGLGGFAITSILCSTASSLPALEIFRGMQGITAAMMLAVSLGIVKNSFPKHQLGKSLGIYSVAIAAGLALGPAIGGIIEGALGWRFIFLINVPIAIISFIICYRVLVRNQPIQVKWDISGTILQFSCLFSVVYLLNYIEGGVNTTAILIAVFSIVTLILFIWNELHVKNPLLNLNIFKNKIFSAFDLSLHFNYICMYMIFFIMPFYLQKVLHLGASFTGLVLTTSPLIMMFLAPISGMLSDKFGSRSLAFIGSIISALALLSLTQLNIFSTVADVLWRLALLGVGAALFQSPINRALMSNTPSGESGVASSIIVTTRNLGMVFAVCFAGILLHTAISPELLQQSQLFNLAAYNFITGMHRVVLFGAILSAMMAGLSLIGFNKYGTIVEDAENVVKKHKTFLEKRVSKQIHQISMVFK